MGKILKLAFKLLGQTWILIAHVVASLGERPRSDVLVQVRDMMVPLQIGGTLGEGAGVQRRPAIRKFMLTIELFNLVIPHMFHIVTTLLNLGFSALSASGHFLHELARSDSWLRLLDHRSCSILLIHCQGRLKTVLLDLRHVGHDHGGL